MLADLVAAFVTLFVVVDPIGLGPVFLGVTQGMARPERQKTAREASLVAFGVLVGAALIGQWLLTKLGIGLPAFRIAGGLLLFVIAFEMVFDRRQKRKTDDANSAAQERDVGFAIFPLAIPLMAGPGAITASILLAGQTDGDILRFVLLIVVMAIIIGICFALFQVAPRVEAFFGRKAQMVFTRILGVLLAALAVQFVVDGIVLVVEAANIAA